MVPFQNIANEFGQMRRVPWAPEKSRAMLKIIRKGVADELNARDCREAVKMGVGNLVKHHKGEEFPVLQTADCVRGKEGGGTYFVNPLASQIKHSGAEATDMVGKRWREFCSEPQADDFTPLEQASTLRERGVYDEKLHRYVYPDGGEPQAEPVGVVAVAEDCKPTRRESFAPTKPARRRRLRDGVDRRTKAYKSQQTAAKENGGGQLPDNDGTADAVSG